MPVLVLQQTINKEMQVLASRETWDLASASLGASIIDCRWEYNDTVVRYKGHLVTKGFFSKIWHRLF